MSTHNDHHPTVADWGLDASEAIQRHTSPEHVESPARLRRPGLVEQFAAIVRDAPCSSNVASNYSDARYYLDRAVATNAATSTVSVQVDRLPGLQQCITATNLAELPGNTHRLLAGTVVEVFALYTRPGVKVYVFNQSPPEGAVVKITATASGAGKYLGRILLGASDADAASDIDMPEGMTIPDADDALICNVEEDGEAGHRIEIPSYAVGQIVGTHDGMTVVMIRGALGSSDSPASLGDGTGGAVSPDDGTWDKASDGTPLDVSVQTRTVWDTSSGTLFGYLRQFSFDARGVLYAVSAENQITIDVAQACQ